MERWDLFTEDRTLTGKTAVRGEEQPDNTYRLVVHIIIFNKDGKMLIQQRQANKKAGQIFGMCLLEAVQ